eukprot:TRINITY_DN15090_c0_g1_i1.p1 TRINITY_DN15090_c0_g1~~TRINITY_DN15090_c0_g1_i1.p1  ORF type:complete len:289 (-),score=70.32 TRINITY_DN15090_c0_g1_i1:129-956(-)
MAENYPADFLKGKALPKHLRNPNKKFNSTSSLYIDSTITKPKNTELVHCIATYVKSLIKHMEENPNPPKPGTTDIFDESKHYLTGKNVDLKEIPEEEAIEKYIKAIFKIGQLAPESLIMGVAYLNRSLNSTTNRFLYTNTWRRHFLSCLILASKVWEDQAVWNVDFLELFPMASTYDLGQLEKRILSLLGFDVSLKASEYAQIYFDLRAHNKTDECEEHGHAHFEELKPLNKEGENTLELRTQKFNSDQCKKLHRSSGSVDDIGTAIKSPRAILN